MPRALSIIADRSRLPPLVVLLALGLLLALANVPWTAHANGATVPVVKNERAGPYELEVGILPGSPRVGNLHLSILVRDSQAGGFITNAIVTVGAQGPPAATSVGPAQAVNTRDAPQFYDLDIPLDTEGEWTLLLNVNSELGQAELPLPIEVTKSGGFSFAFLITVGVALLAALFWTSGLLRRRLKGRR